MKENVYSHKLRNEKQRSKAIRRNGVQQSFSKRGGRTKKGNQKKRVCEI